MGNHHITEGDLKNLIIRLIPGFAKNILKMKGSLSRRLGIGIHSIYFSQLGPHQSVASEYPYCSEIVPLSLQ